MFRAYSVSRLRYVYPRRSFANCSMRSFNAKRFVESSKGGQLAYEIHFADSNASIEDSNDAIFLINGWAMGKGDWAPWLLEGLSQDRPVIALDNRGIGESSVTEGPYTIDLMMDDCIEVIESVYGAKESKKRVHVVGTSMGGMIALKLAIERPDLVKSLVLNGTTFGGRNSTPAEAGFAKEFFSLFNEWNDVDQGVSALPQEQQAKNLDIVERFLRASFASNQIQSEKSFENICNNFATSGSRLKKGILNQLAALGRFNVFGDLLKLNSVGIPVLIIHGEEDSVIPVENAHTMSARISSSRLLVLPKVGHLWQLSNNKILPELQEFFHMRRTT